MVGGGDGVVILGWQMTPAPSLLLQSSLLKWRQSCSLASSPLQATSSMLNREVWMEPKWFVRVKFLAPGKPS